MDNPDEVLEKALSRLSGWVGHNGVVGTMIALADDGSKSLCVMTDGITDGAREAIQSQFAGYPLQFRETGRFQALPRARADANESK